MKLRRRFSGRRAETGQRQKLQRQDRKNTGHEIENKAAQNRRKQQGQRQTAGTVVKDGRLFDSYGLRKMPYYSAGR